MLKVLVITSYLKIVHIFGLNYTGLLLYAKQSVFRHILYHADIIFPLCHMYDVLFYRNPMYVKYQVVQNDTQTQVHYVSTSRPSTDRKSTPTRNTRATQEGRTNHRAVKTVVMVTRKMTTVRLEGRGSSWKNVVHLVLIVHTVTGMAG